jgi:hypothetical protein
MRIHVYFTLNLYLTLGVVGHSQWPNSGRSSERLRNAALWYAFSTKLWYLLYLMYHS